MVVLQIHVTRFAIRKAKREPIVAGDGDRVFAFAPSLQRMKISARQVHVFENCGAVQEVQPDLKPLRHIRRNAFRLACLEKPFDSVMAKAFDHEL